MFQFYFLKILKRFYLFTFRERGRKGEREGEQHQCVRDTWLPLTHPLLGTWRTTQACALTGNWTCDPLVLRRALNPLSHNQSGWFFEFYKKIVNVYYTPMTVISLKARTKFYFFVFSIKPMRKFFFSELDFESDMDVFILILKVII